MNDLALLLAERRRRELMRVKPFPPQQAFINDQSQFLAAECTRRAGKTNGLALRFKRTMDLYPGSLSRYIALTRDSAKDIMWPVLQEMSDVHGWRADFVESTLTMTLPNGSKLRLLGADMKNFIRRLKGAKSPAVAIDEAQEFGDHLKTLVNDVLTPTILDYPGSWIALTGTPGPIPRGMYFDITQGGVGDFSVHRWSLFDNPYLPNAKEFVEDLKKRNRWTDESPSYVREYLGRWVLDLESLLVKYLPTEHNYDALPKAQYNFIMGIDIGFNDADAIAILAWNEQSKTTYLVEELITKKQGFTELVNQIKLLSNKYDVSKMVIDEGGLGKKLAEEIRRQHQIPVQGADKARKMENVGFLNDALRTGLFKAKETSRFAHDSAHVQMDFEKSTPDRLVVKKGFHSDIIDAVLYAFKESPAWAYQKPRDIPKYQSQEYWRQEEERMEAETIERLEREQKSGSDGFGQDWGRN